MGKEIRYLIVFLVIVLAILIYLQNQPCKTVQHFTNDVNGNKNDQLNSRLDPRVMYSSQSALSKKEEMADKTKSMMDSQKMSSKIVNSIMKNQETDQLIQNEDMTENSTSYNMENPVYLNIDKNRNTVDTDIDSLDELIREVETGNNLQINNPNHKLYKKRSTSVNSAKNGFRKVSYADSAYRVNFNGENDSMSSESQQELDNMYDDALIFKNSEYTTNNNFTGKNDTDGQWESPNLKDFTTTGQQNQQEKILNMYNSTNYLPNESMLDKKLADGFQILENPVSVKNPNLIPVLRSIPVSSIMGSNKNATYDIRSEPPCPKTVVSPFLNSSIMPDIYAPNRGCL